MTTIRITKEFKFEMAHALLEYDGPCKNIHGHSYVLFVTLMGKTQQQQGASDDGMVMDFGELKRLINDTVISKFDHALVLNDQSPQAMLDAIKGFHNLVLLPYQPTCENLLEDFARRIKAALPDGVILFSLKLNETASSYAEWFALDN
jgi:6-pyruvoyltetrahydropterin/6-carboxytetrahydropterin synthase